MATHQAVAATSAAIVRLLASASLQDPLLPPCTVVMLQAEQPREPADGAVVGVLLYRVSLSEVQADDGLPGPGRPHTATSTVVDLHYLVTASTADAATSQHLLGWAISVLDDSPVLSAATLNDLPGAPAVFEDGEIVMVAWEPLSLADLYAVRGPATEQPAASATYVARGVRIA